MTSHISRDPSQLKGSPGGSHVKSWATHTGKQTQSMISGRATYFYMWKWWTTYWYSWVSAKMHLYSSALAMMDLQLFHTDSSITWHLQMGTLTPTLYNYPVAPNISQPGVGDVLQLKNVIINVFKTQCWYLDHHVNIDSTSLWVGKPLALAFLEPMLTNFHDAILNHQGKVVNIGSGKWFVAWQHQAITWTNCWQPTSHQWDLVTFTWGQFHKKLLMMLYQFKITAAPPTGQWVNSLWLRDIIWWHGSWSTLVQVMACCLMAPSHYLNQCGSRWRNLWWIAKVQAFTTKWTQSSEFCHMVKCWTHVVYILKYFGAAFVAFCVATILATSSLLSSRASYLPQ